MAQPLARRLRTARPRGLTSPDQVRTPRRKATPIPDLDPGTPEPRNPGTSEPKPAFFFKSAARPVKTVSDLV